jgi:hypothetical protein
LRSGEKRMNERKIRRKKQLRIKVDEFELKLHQYLGISPFPPTFAAAANISLSSAFNLDYTRPGKSIEI